MKIERGHGRGKGKGWWGWGWGCENFPLLPSGGGGTSSYGQMGYIGTCRSTGYGFWAFLSGTGYHFSRVQDKDEKKKFNCYVIYDTLITVNEKCQFKQILEQ